MHVPDSADIGGGGLYTQGPPRSVIGRHILNALVQEVLGILSDAGVTPRASGAIDAAASYTGQLLAAVKIVANKRLSEAAGMSAAPNNIAITGNGQTITPANFVNRLTGTAANGWFISLLENDTNYANRIILVVNNTTHNLFVNFVYLGVGQSSMFYYDSGSNGLGKWMPFRARGTDEIPEGNANFYYTDARFDTAFATAFAAAIDAYWTANYNDRFTSRLNEACDNSATLHGEIDARADARIDLRIASGSFTYNIRGGTSGNSYGTGTAYWSYTAGLYTVSFPSQSFTPSAAEDSFQFRLDSNSNLPSPLAGSVVSFSQEAVRVAIAGVHEVGWAYHYNVGEYIALIRASAATFASGIAMTSAPFMVRFQK